MKRETKRVLTWATVYLLFYVWIMLEVEPHVFWFRMSRLLQGTAYRVGRAGLAAEAAYVRAVERVKL